MRVRFCDRDGFIKILLLTCAVAAVCYIVFFLPGASSLLFSVFLLILFSAAWVGPPAARLSVQPAKFTMLACERARYGMTATWLWTDPAPCCGQRSRRAALPKIGGQPRPGAQRALNT